MDINDLVTNAILEQKGLVGGGDMLNDKLFGEPGYDKSDGHRGDLGGVEYNSAQKVEKTYGTDQSSFANEKLPLGNTSPSNPNPDNGGTPPVVKLGAGKMFDHAMTAVKRANDSSVIKSTNVKNSLGDEPYIK